MKKLFILAGNAIDSLIDQIKYNDFSVYRGDDFYIDFTNAKIIKPKKYDKLFTTTQVELIYDLIKSYDHQDLIIFTNNPLVLETALKSAKKFSNNWGLVKCIYVSYKDESRTQFNFEVDNSAEKCFIDFNRAFAMLDKLFGEDNN